MPDDKDKNKEKENKEQIKVLEQKIKTAFKGGDFEAVKKLAQQIRGLEPENRLAKKLVEKAEAKKKEEESKAKAAKVKEYEAMLKKLLKEGDVEKLKALIAELKEFDPGAKAAGKYLAKAEKLEAKAKAAEEKKKSKKVKKEAPVEKREEKVEKKKEVKKETKEKKAGFFASLFKKKEKKEEKKPDVFAAFAKKSEEKEEKAEAKVEVKAEEKVEAKPEAAPAAPKPVAPAPLAPKPLTPVAPLAAKPLTPAATAPAPKPAVPAAFAKPKEKKGNLFTRMFGGKEEAKDKKSIIDTIVAKTGEAKKVEKKEAKKEVKKIKGVKKEEDAGAFLTFARVFMNFAAVFIVFSAGFLYVDFIDKENTFLSLVGIQENTGSRLHKASEETRELSREEAILNQNIELYKGGYQDNSLDIVANIIDERINWPDIFAKINEVTNSVYELNDFFKYVEYNNYSFDAEKGAIRVSGTLSDPLGRNLTKLVELEEAFKYYPKDKNNPDDPTKSYFHAFREFTSFSKTLDQKTGRYTSNFQLSFALSE